MCLWDEVDKSGDRLRVGIWRQKGNMEEKDVARVDYELGGEGEGNGRENTV